MITSKCWSLVDGLASVRSGRSGAAYECHYVREIFDFLFRLSLAYMEAGSEPYDGFLALKRRQEKYLEAWRRRYTLIVLQAENVCLGRASRSRSAARPVSACMRNLEGDYLVGVLWAIGNEIPDEVDGHSGMSALQRKMLPESILDNFGHLFIHLYISNSLCRVRSSM